MKGKCPLCKLFSLEHDLNGVVIFHCRLTCPLNIGTNKTQKCHPAYHMWRKWSSGQMVRIILARKIADIVRNWEIV